jgi:hypothetical protein
MTKEQYLYKKYKLDYEYLKALGSSKKIINALNRRKFEGIENVVAAFATEKRKRGSDGGFIKFDIDRYMAILLDNIPYDESPFEDVIVPVPIKIRSGVAWFNVKKKSEVLLKNSIFATKYKTSSDFASFATDEEVFQLSEQQHLHDNADSQGTE